MYALKRGRTVSSNNRSYAGEQTFEKFDRKKKGKQQQKPPSRITPEQKAPKGPVKTINSRPVGSNYMSRSKALPSSATPIPKNGGPRLRQARASVVDRVKSKLNAMRSGGQAKKAAKMSEQSAARAKALRTRVTSMKPVNIGPSKNVRPMGGGRKPGNGSSMVKANKSAGQRASMGAKNTSAAIGNKFRQGGIAVGRKFKRVKDAIANKRRPVDKSTGKLRDFTEGKVVGNAKRAARASKAPASAGGMGLVRKGSPRVAAALKGLRTGLKTGRGKGIAAGLAVAAGAGAAGYAVARNRKRKQQQNQSR